MTEFKSLDNENIETLYNAFSEAFKDYEMQLNSEQLQRMLKRRGFVPELSFGAFDKGRLVAFTYNGIGVFNGEKTAYDTGTGTVPEYRGQGLAGRIFEYSLPWLREAGVKQYLLEVLQHNDAAVALYRKIGFSVSREFDYFVAPKNELRLKEVNPLPSCEIRRIDIPDMEAFSMMEDFESSWQNSNDAILRSPGDFSSFGAWCDGEFAGYAVFDPYSGDITRLAVSPGYRRKGVGTMILHAVVDATEGNIVKVINIPSDKDGPLAFLAANGFRLTGKQFEMIREI